MQDEEEFSKERIQISIQDNKRFWANETIGEVMFEAAEVNKTIDHEFYKQWTNIVLVDPVCSSHVTRQDRIC